MMLRNSLALADMKRCTGPELAFALGWPIREPGCRPTCFEQMAASINACRNIQHRVLTVI